MQPIPPTVVSLLWLPVAVLLFLLPGFTLARRLRMPAPELFTFCAAAALFFNLVLLLDALRAPLHTGTLAPALVVIAAGVWWRIQPRTDLAPAVASAFGSAIWYVSLILGGAAVAGRAVVDPLSGYDNVFRWDYLARLFVVHESLAGYPPLTSADFELYSWCDGIPPLVSLQHFWIYTVTGSFAPALTAVRVVGEFVLLALAVWRYAGLLWGNRAGAAALAVFASSSLALWSVAMGQETGVTALSLVGMLYYLELHARAPSGRLLLAAALAAGVGALTREYCLAYPLLGLGVLLARRQGRAAVAFALIAGAVAAPWYLRNWAITANPLYPQTLHGLFPGNRVHEEMMAYYRDYWGLSSSPFSAGVIPLFLLVLAGPLIVLGVIGIMRLRRAAALPAAGVVAVSAIWYFLNLPQSGGGWVYSARVLLPALVLLAAVAGWIAHAPRALRVALLVGLTLCSVDAARRSWLLPAFPLTPATDYSFSGWRQMRDFAYDPGPYVLWQSLTQQAQSKGIIVDHPAHHALLTLSKGTAIPLVSPLLAPAFDETADFERTLSTLRQDGVRFATLTPANPISAKLIAAHRFWSELCRRYRPNRQVRFVAVYDLDQLIPATPP